MQPTLAYNMDDLKAEIGFHKGYGLGETKGEKAWTTYQETRIDFYVKEGLNSYYYPMADENGVVHNWSFLLPTATFTLESGQSTLDLPIDFNGFEGILTYSVSGQSYFEQLQLTGEAMVRKRYQAAPTTTGRPEQVAVRPKKNIEAGQRWDLYFWPIADQDYDIEGTYHIAPDFLTETSPWVYGGPQHSSTVLAACLATSEEHGDNEMGPMKVKFLEKLRTSIALDRRTKPTNLGYNSDRSDHKRGVRDNRGWYGYPTVTVNGNEYS